LSQTGLSGTSVAPTIELKSNLIRMAIVAEVTPDVTCEVALIVSGPAHHPKVSLLKLVVVKLTVLIGAVVVLPALMYVS
jgi:hypothetical protein